MLSLNDAEKVLLSKLPNAYVRTFAQLDDLLIFVVYSRNDVESFFDPYYSVNLNNSVVSEYSIFTDSEDASLFSQFKINDRGYPPEMDFLRKGGE